MFDALVWLLAVEFLGILAFPLTFTLFRRLPDRGYTLTKPLALVFFSYILWVLGLTHLIPNSLPTVIAILSLGAVISSLVLWRKLREIRPFLRREGWTLIVAEALFLGFFFLWLAIVSEIPAINHTEKPMDFAFLNAIGQNRYFPPEDPWLAGHSISYYYFGHLMMALLTKLTAVPSSISYNLAISLIPALVGTGSFGLVYNLVRLSGSRGGFETRPYAIGFGLVAPALVMLIGNLEGVLEFVHGQGWGSESFWKWVGIKGLEGGAATSSSVFPDQHWWWWRATRVIDTLADGRSLDYTITEFPFFSFILGDLHPHAMSLPFLLLNLSLGLNLFLSPAKPGLGWLRRHWGESTAIALFLGSLGFINIWDFPVFAAILGTVVLAKSYGDLDGDIGEVVKATASVTAPIVLVAVVLFLPFYLTLSSQASGILPWRDVSTRPFLFFLVMGLFFVLGISFLLRQLPGLARPNWRDTPAVVLLLVVTLTPFLLWSAIELLLSLFNDGIIAAGLKIGGKFWWTLPGLAIVGLAGYSAAQRMRRSRGKVPRPVGARGLGPVLSAVEGVSPRVENFPLLSAGEGGQGDEGGGQAGPAHLRGKECRVVGPPWGGELGERRPVHESTVLVFPLLLLAVAFYMLVGVELFYLTDLFGNRMNTVFKVYYQSWLLLAMVGAYGVYYWQSRQLSKRLIFRLGHYAWASMVAVLIMASLYYPVGAVLDRTGILSGGHTLKDNTLDGLAFLKSSDPGEYAAIAWLRGQAPWGRIVEAVGDDYSDYGRISASTGRPTILGWKGHEQQWRGTTRAFHDREVDVSQIYRSDDLSVVRGLLDRYDVRYVYVGRRERASYGSEHLSKFGGFMKTVFEQGGVIIYERLEVVEHGGRSRVR